MYGAKIIFENRKSSRLPVKFAAIVRCFIDNLSSSLVLVLLSVSGFFWHKTATYTICKKIWARHANVSNKKLAVKSVIKRLECKTHGMRCPWFLAIKTSWCLNSGNYFVVVYCRWLIWFDLWSWRKADVRFWARELLDLYLFCVLFIPWGKINKIILLPASTLVYVSRIPRRLKR